MPALDGLEDVFKPGPVFQDRNGDGFIDFVAARLVLGETPTSSDVAAASEVMARLGFETSAMQVPLPRESGRGETLIVIGTAGASQAGLSAAAMGGK